MALTSGIDSEGKAGRLQAGLDALRDLAGLRHPMAKPVLIYFLAVLLPIGFNLGPIYMTGVRLVLILLIIPLTLNLLAGRYGKLLLTDILFFLHVAWMVAALWVNNPDRVISNAGSTGVEFIGGYVVGRAFIRSREDFMAMIRLISFVVICLLPFALYETLTGTAPILKILNSLPGISSLKDLSIGERLGFERVQMVFAHPIHFGLFCALMLPLCWIGMKGIYSDTTRLLITLAVGISGISALSSGALLAILLQLGLIVWAWITRGTDKRWIILLILFAIAYVVVDLLSNRTPIMVFLSYATFSPHTAYWRTLIFHYGMENVWANPIFGLGLNDWVRPRWMYSGSMDNFWLVNAVRYGIPGFAFLAAGYVIALWRIGRRNFDQDIVLWQFRRAWMFSFIGLTFTICTVHIWHSLYSFVFFMFGTGMWFLTAEPRLSTAETTPKHPAEDRNSVVYSRRDAGAVAFSRDRSAEQSEPRLSNQGKAPANTYRREPTADTGRNARSAPTYSRFAAPPATVSKDED